MKRFTFIRSSAVKFAPPPPKFSFRAALCVLTAGAALLAGSFHAIHAQTLERIQKTGIVRIGIHGDQAPWGYVGGDGQIQGYDADVARLIAQDLGAKLELVPNVPAARIPNLLTNKVDMQVAIMGMYPDRARVVQFSKPYSGLKMILMASKKHNITGADDMRNLRVGVPRSSSLDTAVTAWLGDSPNIFRFDDDSSNMQALIGGQIDAVGANTTYKMNLDRLAPGNDYEQKRVFNEQWQGVATRLKDKKINEWLNQFIDKITMDGRLEAISQKHLGMPLPEFPTSVEGVPFVVQ